NKGVMRVGGRLENSQLPYSGKHPIILPSTGKLTEVIVSAQLTSFLARTADEALKSFPMDQHSYHSASNSLLARTEDRIPKTFALQGDSSRPTTHRHPSALLIQSPAAGRDVTWNLLVHSSVSSLLMEISRRF
ncbi:hypothetical protein AVEN_157526-1, partial [Araneus ventricosus]